MLLNSYPTLLWWTVLGIFCQCQLKQTEKTLEFLQFVLLLGSLKVVVKLWWVILTLLYCSIYSKCISLFFSPSKDEALKLLFLGLHPDRNWAYPRKCTSDRWITFLWLDEKENLKWSSMGDACTHYSESSIPQLHPGIQVPAEYCRISIFIFYCTCMWSAVGCKPGIAVTKVLAEKCLTIVCFAFLRNNRPT